MNSCEIIAQKLSELGVNSVSAISRNNEFVSLIDGKYWIVYPWLAGSTLSTQDQISDDNLQKITLSLAKIHNSDLKIGNKPDNNQHYTDYSKWENLSQKIQKLNYVWVPECTELIESIKLWYDKIHSANKKLNSHLVFSHCDLDKKNVMWNESNEPFIIDWESAGYINPTKELLQFAIDWSSDQNNIIYPFHN